jgi:hypothetical protein
LAIGRWPLAKGAPINQRCEEMVNGKRQLWLAKSQGPTAKDWFRDAYKKFKKRKPAARTRAHSQKAARDAGAAATEHLPFGEPYLRAGH